jgi:ketol-acid reductoisomerase
VTGKILFEPDLDSSILDTKRVGIIGYGSQGRAQALNLRDSGFTPAIGVRPGASFEAACRDGFTPLSPREVSSVTDVVMVLTPDETHADVCEKDVSVSARDGTYVGFAAGFAVHFGDVRFRNGLRPILVAPKGPGRLLRSTYVAGGGIPALVAGGGSDTDGLGIAMAYAKALGCGRAGVVETTFREEAIADLFGEQCVLCGGLVELMKAGFDILVDRGYTPEVAYIECVAEVEYIASLISRVGLADLGRHISSTASYGGATRGPRIIDSEVRKRLEAILDEIEDGRFYGEFRRSARGRGGTGARREGLERLERVRAVFRTGGGNGR